MKNRQMLKLLSLTVLCAMAFTATAAFATNEQCPDDAVVAAVSAFIVAAAAVEEAQHRYDAALASTSLMRLHFVIGAAINLASAKQIVSQRRAEAKAAIRARLACLRSIS